MMIMMNIVIMIIMIMMLETGCSVDEDDDDMEKICSFVLSASLDANAVQHNATAQRIFKEVCNNLIITDNNKMQKLKDYFSNS